MFITRFIAALGLLLTAVSSAGALGINCQGDGNCFNGNQLQQFYNLADGLQQGRFYQNDERIMCQPYSGLAGGAFCLFLSGTGFGAPASSFKTLIKDLMDHGCQACGSIPLFFPDGDNSPNRGVLKSDWVSGSKTGACGRGPEVAQIC